MDLDKALELAKQIAVEEGDKLMEFEGRLTEEHGASFKDDEGVDLATNFDREAEKRIVARLAQGFPECGFVLEENKDLEKDAEYKWTVDPIDGTKYFISGIPLYAVMIGLLDGDEPILGVVYNPATKQLYSGSINHPAELNGHRVEVSKERLLNRSLLAINLRTRLAGDKFSEWFLKKFAVLGEKAYRLRMFGSALPLCWIAQGSILNVYAEVLGHNVYDAAPGIAICKAAGAKVKLYENPVNNTVNYVVGSPEVVDQVYDILNGE